MKTIYSIAVLLTLGLLHLSAQNPTPGSSPTSTANQTGVPAPTTYHIVDRGPNQKVWQRETYTKLPDGSIVSHTHRFVELATGISYQDANGQLVDSKEEIEPYSEGAIARHGQYQVIFANNLNSAGAIDQQTPDGKRLRSNILGLAYYDLATGNTVMIAEIQDSQGELISSNQVLYPDAFDGMKADVRYTYKKASFEQDVILRERPPTPESVGLNSQTTEIEVLTEFIDPPRESIIEHPDRKTGQTDEDISWGAMNIGRGKAFDLEQSQPTRQRVSVKRQYKTLDGRKILLEIVPVKNIQAGLQGLPLQSGRKSSLPRTVSREPLLPKTPLAQTARKEMKLASSAVSHQGYVLDYLELNTDQSNYTFQGDITYLVDGAFNLTGTTTFEGGTVIKSDVNGQINIDASGAILCKTAPYLPAIFTSVNDDFVGETMAFSGDPYYNGTEYSPANPTYSDVICYLNLDCSNAVIRNVRFSYVFLGAICTDGGTSGDGDPDVWPDQSLDIWDSQFVNIDEAISAGDILNISLHNVLIANGFLDGDEPIEFNQDGSLTAEQCTFADDGPLVYKGGDDPLPLNYTNCIFTGTSLGGGLISTQNVVIQPFSWVDTNYQAVGYGSYYLATNSPYRNAGTTNISPEMLAELAHKTTYPPVIFTTTNVITDTVLTPVAQRDTDVPDIGYHYDPIDYLADCMISNATLTLSGGVSLAYGSKNLSPRYRNGGMILAGTGNLVSQGAAGNDNDIVYFNAVQETHPADPTASPVFFFQSVSSSNSISLAFTKIIVPLIVASEGYDAFDLVAGSSLNLNDCEIYSANAGSLLNANGNYTIHNNLFSYPHFTLYGGGNVSVHNNLFIGDSSSYAYIEGTNTDDAFSGLYTDLSGTINHNAYLNSAGVPATFQTGDIVTNLTWVSGTLGGYYQPPNSPLINAGSTPADQFGLYHFTTQTNQVPETNSVVDIGYHYVATDTNGVPLDTNGDGIPDYLEDANGNGIFDAGDLGEWNISPYGLNSGNALQVFTPLK